MKLTVQPVVAEMLPGGQGYRVRFLPPWTHFPGADEGSGPVPLVCLIPPILVERLTDA